LFIVFKGAWGKWGIIQTVPPPVFLLYSGKVNNLGWSLFKPEN
jgi:hypothetical protein